MNTGFTEYYGCGVKHPKKARVPQSPKTQPQTASLELYINRIEELAGENALLLKSQSDYDYIKKEWVQTLEDRSKLMKSLENLNASELSLLRENRLFWIENEKLKEELKLREKRIKQLEDKYEPIKTKTK